MRAYIAALSLLSFASVIHASTWIAVSTARFEVVTDCGESEARLLVTSLEQFDGAIAQSPGIEATSGVTKIYLFRSEKEFAEFRSHPGTAGFTLSTSHAAPFVLMFANGRAREVAFHEYVHVLVQRGDWKLPRWFEEGLAEFYGHARPAGRDKLSLGDQVPEHMSLLRGQPITATLLEEPLLTGSQGRYYAASWALVHMILTDPDYRSKTEELLKARPSDAIFKKAIEDLQLYVARPVWKQQTVEAPKSSINATLEAIPPVDAEFMLATLLLDAGQPQAARKRYAAIAAAHHNDAISAEAAGFSALSVNDRAIATRQFRRAIELKTSRARVWSELAMLEKEAGAPWQEVKPLLERIAILDPADYQAVYLLGIREADDGDLKHAVDHLAAAAQGAPGKSDVWHAYALALSQGNRPEDARVAAQRSLRVATTVEWEQRAATLLESLKRPQMASAVRRKPEVVTSPAWTTPKPDAEIRGRFLDFACQADPPRLRLDPEGGGKVVELKIADPKQVNLLNTASGGASIELRCGPQDGRPIRVGYRVSDGTVLELEFLQVHDLPRF